MRAFSGAGGGGTWKDLTLTVPGTPGDYEVDSTTGEITITDVPPANPGETILALWVYQTDPTLDLGRS
ncbi:MAG: hypothetical protein AAFO89_05860 [Planctomycetota bacterium]